MMGDLPSTLHAEYMATLERLADVQRKLALAELERDDALKALGTLYIANLKAGRA